MAPKAKKSKVVSSIDANLKLTPQHSKKAGSTLLELDTTTPCKRTGLAREGKKLIEKIIYDNSRTLSNPQVYMVVKDEITLFDRLIRDKELSGKGGITMGKLYYDNLRAKYEEADGPLSRLRVLNASDPEDATLLEALIAVRKYNSDPAPFLAWLERDAVPNQKNCVALMRVVLQLDPYVGKIRCELLMQVLKWCHKVDFHNAFPAIMRKVVAHFDKVFEKSWLIMKAQGMLEKVWWMSVNPHAAIVLPHAPWAVCIAPQD